MSATDPALPPVPAFRDLAVAGCAVHPARAAVALCRTCLQACCGECATRRDGVNYCAACLAASDTVLATAPGARQVRDAQRAATRGGAILGTPARVAFTLAAYSLIAMLAAAWGIGMPFFANERRLEANRERVTQVQIALSSYYDDVGTYPSRERGLAALLASSEDDRDAWRGPYTTVQAAGGKGVNASKDPGVADVFGAPILYFAKPGDDGAMVIVYLASPGANGTWDTPGIDGGNPPHEPSGDDVLKWVVWP